MRMYKIKNSCLKIYHANCFISKCLLHFIKKLIRSELCDHDGSSTKFRH